MTRAPRTIKVPPDSELADLLDESETPLVLVKDGIRYRLDREQTVDAGAEGVELAPTMTLEEAYASVPALPEPVDFKDVERITNEEHLGRIIRK